MKNTLIASSLTLILGIGIGWSLTPRLPPSPISSYVPPVLPPNPGGELEVRVDPKWDYILEERFYVQALNVEECGKYAYKYREDNVLVDIIKKSESDTLVNCIFEDKP